VSSKKKDFDELTIKLYLGTQKNYQKKRKREISQEHPEG